MREIIVLFVLVFAALVQVTVAPLFPIRGAVFDFMLVTLLILTVYAGPRVGMVAMPLGAVLLAFATNRSPGLLILAYLPLVPAVYVLADSRVPMSRLVQAFVVALGTGLWVRIVLSAGPMLEGADFTLSGILFGVLVPGLFLDILLVTFLYLPIRLLGWSARSMTLQRSGFGA